MSPKPWPKMANSLTHRNTEVAYVTKEELTQVQANLDSLRNELSEKFSSLENMMQSIMARLDLKTTEVTPGKSNNEHPHHQMLSNAKALHGHTTDHIYPALGTLSYQRISLHHGGRK